MRNTPGNEQKEDIDVNSSGLQSVFDPVNQRRLYNDYPTCSKQDVCTTTTQRVPTFVRLPNVFQVNQGRLYNDYPTCSVWNTLGSRCTNVASWNTLGSRCTNVAGSLGYHSDMEVFVSHLTLRDLRHNRL